MSTSMLMMTTMMTSHHQAGEHQHQQQQPQHQHSALSDKDPDHQDQQQQSQQSQQQQQQQSQQRNNAGDSGFGSGLEQCLKKCCQRSGQISLEGAFWLLFLVLLLGLLIAKLTTRVTMANVGYIAVGSGVALVLFYLMATVIYKFCCEDSSTAHWNAHARFTAAAAQQRLATEGAKVHVCAPPRMGGAKLNIIYTVGDVPLANRGEKPATAPSSGLVSPSSSSSQVGRIGLVNQLSDSSAGGDLPLQAMATVAETHSNNNNSNNNSHNNLTQHNGVNNLVNNKEEGPRQERF